MKKLFTFGLFLIVSTSAWAKTTLRIPVYTENGMYASQLNKLLKANGLKPLPLYFEASTVDKQTDLYKKYGALNQDVKAATKALGKESELMTESIPNSDFKGTCYTGTGGEDVAELVSALSDTIYSDQLVVLGWKYKKQSGIGSQILENSVSSGISEEEFKIRLSKESKLWRQWRGTGEAVLVLAATSDDGDDVNESLIYKCK